MNDNDTSAVSGLSKSDLVLEFWAFRQMFLSRIRYLGPKDGCAEDIFQEACVRFLASRAVFVHPGAATRYFCRTLRSLVADHFKHQARIQYLEDLPELMCNPWQTYCLQENAASVWKAAKRLPVRDRQLLHVYINRHAHKLFRQIPRSTLGYRTTKVRRKLRRMIGQNPDYREPQRFPFLCRLGFRPLALKQQDPSRTECHAGMGVRKVRQVSRDLKTRIFEGKPGADFGWLGRISSGFSGFDFLWRDGAGRIWMKRYDGDMKIALLSLLLAFLLSIPIFIWVPFRIWLRNQREKRALNDPPEVCHSCGKQDHVVRYKFAFQKVIEKKTQWGGTIASSIASMLLMIPMLLFGRLAFRVQKPSTQTTVTQKIATLFLCKACHRRLYSVVSDGLAKNAYSFHPWYAEAVREGYVVLTKDDLKATQAA